MEADPINNWELKTASDVVNIVVVGKAGNGKSATGNSILGRDAFFSNLSPSGVTCTSELQRTVLNDGRIVNVIDTPVNAGHSERLALFVFSVIISVEVATVSIPRLYQLNSKPANSHTMEADPITDLELTTASNVVNIVIVGKAGNGKSATGNSILGREAFFSNPSPLGVTKLQRTILNDGRIVNVIDTPGLFDFSTDFEVINGEIVKCIDLAKGGIHAILMVFSIGSRFTREEKTVFESMKSLFGDKIINYMIIVFTGGDILESKKKSLKDYMSLFPEPLRNIIQQCNNRVIIFDNTTKNMIKREGQVNELLALVESAIADNGGKPYSNKIFAELKEGALLWHQNVKEVEAKEGCSKVELSELMNENIKSYNDQLKHVIEMVEEKQKLSIEMLGKQLAREQAARSEAERFAGESQKELYEIRKLREELNEARKQSEEFKRLVTVFQMCSIL